MGSFARLSLVLAIGACGSERPAQPAPDAELVTPWPCFAGQPDGLLGSACVYHSGPRVLGDMLVKTSLGDDGPCEADFRAPYCVISGTTLTIQAGATVTAWGTRPLLLVADDAIIVEGTIDVGSHRATPGLPGAGADDPRCVDQPGSEDAAGGTGGAAGSFHFDGGVGGSVGATAGPRPSAPPNSTQLHGGCGGSAGGAYQGHAGGVGGHGGGAVYLMARNAIVLDAQGRILAGGAGGIGGGYASGGGGAGAGGMIVLDAPAVRSTAGARLIAEGGGGGAGGHAGGVGQDGEDAPPDVAALGGIAAGAAGSGGSGSLAGAGSAGGAGATDGPDTSGGGGGGGGASGYIAIFGKLAGDVIASPPTGL